MTKNVQHFSRQGPWVISSLGFTVRALRRAGTEYVDAGKTTRIDSESMATTAFVVYGRSIPALRRLVERTGTLLQHAMLRWGPKGRAASRTTITSHAVEVCGAGQAFAPR